MATLYVENVPEALYKALRARAKQNHRLIAGEVISILEVSVPTVAQLKKREDSPAQSHAGGSDAIPGVVATARSSGRTLGRGTRFRLRHRAAIQPLVL